jgi:hypothetical protein
MVWQREQDSVKRRFYDLVIADLKKQCEKADVSVSAAFPEPEGMEAWREAHPTPSTPEQVSEEYRQRQKQRESTENE